MSSVDLNATATGVPESFELPAMRIDEERHLDAANRVDLGEVGEAAAAVGRRCDGAVRGGRRPCHPVAGGDGGRLIVAVPRRQQIVDPAPPEPCLVGRSPAFKRMMALVSRAAPTETGVLLLGPSGSGKELVAEAIHRLSRRARGPFVPVDCSGLSPTLFESELFGHEKGSFTGALTRTRGLVEAAAGGTLFLDEIGDVPLELQVKLLRLLEAGTYRRVGSTTQHNADFRVVCATHCDLAAMVAQRTFREDLYFRISAFPIRLPPLRERREDIPALVDACLQRCGHAVDRRVSSEAMAMLVAYHFPGNVRELLNIVERGCVLADGETIGPEHIGDALQRAPTAVARVQLGAWSAALPERGAGPCVGGRPVPHAGGRPRPFPLERIAGDPPCGSARSGWCGSVAAAQPSSRGSSPSASRSLR